MPSMAIRLGCTPDWQYGYHVAHQVVLTGIRLDVNVAQPPKIGGKNLRMRVRLPLDVPNAPSGRAGVDWRAVNLDRSFGNQ